MDTDDPSFWPADPTPSSGESLLEQFREGLDLASFFEGTMQGTPEYTEKFNQAKQTLDVAMKVSFACTLPTLSPLSLYLVESDHLIPNSWSAIKDPVIPRPFYSYFYESVFLCGPVKNRPHTALDIESPRLPCHIL